MHGADNQLKPVTAKHAAAAGAERAIQTKAVLKNVQTPTTMNTGGKLKAGNPNEVKKPTNAPAGCNSWWNF